MVVDIALFTPWFCRLQCSAWCVKKGGSNVFLTTVKLVTNRKAGRKRSILERKERPFRMGVAQSLEKSAWEVGASGAALLYGYPK
jgi:hypothetical protein